MRKALLNKKIALFKEAFPEHKVSATGSLYTELSTQKHKKEIIINSRCVTKGTLDKIGTKRSFNIDMSCRLLLTSTGKLMINEMGGKFKTLGMKDLFGADNRTEDHGRTAIMLGDLAEDSDTGVKKLSGKALREARNNVIQSIADIFFVGKKYEWIRLYPQLWALPYFRSFPSLSAAKNYIGYTFISNEQFVHLFSTRTALQRLIEAQTHEQKVAMVQFLDDKRATETLEDLWRLCEELKIPMVAIPESKTALNEAHDKLVTELSLKGAEKYSEEKIEYKSDIFDYWKGNKLVFEILDSPRRLYIEGQRQSHCIGSYTNQMKKNIFVSFTWEDRTYDLMMRLDGMSVQFYGKRNCQPPEELRMLVIPKDRIPIEVVEPESAADVGARYHNDWDYNAIFEVRYREPQQVNLI